MVLRRVVRHAKEWGVPTWIVKLDVRKAFDSVWQESMGDMVASRVGGLRPGGGGTAGGRLWEARAWLGLLDAREMQVAVGDTLTSIPQTNGVRQGLWDSPVLFSRVADCLEAATEETQDMLGPAKGPPPPQAGGAFMDDTYLWSHDYAHLQATLACLERRLAQHGLLINPKKTAIIFSLPEGSDALHIGGEAVACKPFGEVITALGSPITIGESSAAIVAEKSSGAEGLRQAWAPLMRPFAHPRPHPPPPDLGPRGGALGGDSPGRSPMAS